MGSVSHMSGSTAGVRLQLAGPTIGALIITYIILGGSLFSVYYTGPQNPILIIKALMLNLKLMDRELACNEQANKQPKPKKLSLGLRA